MIQGSTTSDTQFGFHCSGPKSGSTSQDESSILSSQDQESGLHPVIPEDSELLWNLRPKKRSDCAKVPRPCPFVSCLWNNYLDVKDGKIHHQLPMAPEDVPAEVSCSLDLIGAYPEDLGVSFTEEEIAAILGVKPVDVKQVFEGAIRKLRHYKTAQELLRLWKLYREE
jgi:hypothetical protein